ncbi:PAS domain-containing protein [Thermodesulfobacteriota bacterium]
MQDQHNPREETAKGLPGLSQGESKPEGRGDPSPKEDEHYRKLIEDVPEPTLILAGPRGTIIAANHSVTRTLKYEEDQLLGRNLSVLYGTKAEGPIKEILGPIAAPARLFDNQEIMRADGKALHMDLQTRLVGGGEAPRILVRLIPAGKRGQSHQREDESSAFLQFTLDALSAHICVLDDTGKIETVNSAWRRFAACEGLEDPDAGIGSNYLAVCEKAVEDGEEDAGEIVDAIRQMISGEISRYSNVNTCHSKQIRRWFLTRLSRFERSGITKILVAHEDVTDARIARDDQRTVSLQQSAVSGVGRLALSAAASSEIIESAVAECWKNLCAHVVGLLELQPDGRNLLLRTGRGWRPGVIGEMLDPGGESQVPNDACAFREWPEEDDLIGRTTAMDFPLLEDHGVVDAIGAVIHGSDRPFGVLLAGSAAPDVFTREDVHFLEAMANLLSGSITKRLSERALDLVHGELRQLIDAVDVPILTVDRDGRVRPKFSLGQPLQLVSC